MISKPAYTLFYLFTGIWLEAEKRHSSGIRRRGGFLRELRLCFKATGVNSRKIRSSDHKRSGLAKLLDLLYSQIPQPGTSLPAKFVIQCGPHLAMLGSSGKCLVGLIQRNVVHQEADAILTSRGMLVAPTGELKRSRQHWAAGAGAPLSPPCTIYLLFPTSSSIG